ncbi:Aminotransferase [Lachnellula suecica]|uniref:aromatic-amino-acid transaminase n=1 Tax=Lachnellula suecica TaxID=602035 RepID=A0A8T9CLF9_9HELO|nr:Aminotransferase [Lachnellula suecica]
MAAVSTSKRDFSFELKPQHQPFHANPHVTACKGLTIENVAQSRSIAGPLPLSVAASTSSDNYKSVSCYQHPKAKSWKHRFTREAMLRGPTRLRALATVTANPGLITLGSGRPSSEYFPFEEIQVKIPKPPYFLDQEATKGIAITTGKYDTRHGLSSYDLALSLNYSHGAGSPQLLRFVTEHTEIVHHPPYSDWECCLTAGNTSGLDMVFRMFCKPGDHVLMEDYTYSGTLEAAYPLGIHITGVRMDQNGLSATHLDEMLTDWDTSPGSATKPSLLYMIPTGQNPTGVTQSLTRRREVYAVAEKHDIYIIEDDPYYFLQMGKYQEHAVEKSAVFNPELVGHFLSKLLPSYLSLDISGRVLRLESTAKILAPGLRCAWLTASSEVVQRFLYHQDVSTVQPSGVSQLIMYKVLDEAWGHEGFFQWLMYLRHEYSKRRDIIIQACEEYLPRDICQWQRPEAGMFLWIELQWRKHPLVKKGGIGKQDLEERIFREAVNRGVLYCQGSWFRAGEEIGDRMFLRTTFSAAPLGDVQKAIERLGSTLKSARMKSYVA